MKKTNLLCIICIMAFIPSFCNAQNALMDELAAMYKKQFSEIQSQVVDVDALTEILNSKDVQKDENMDAINGLTPVVKKRLAKLYYNEQAHYDYANLAYGHFKGKVTPEELHQLTTNVKSIFCLNLTLTKFSESYSNELNTWTSILHTMIEKGITPNKMDVIASQKFIDTCKYEVKDLVIKDSIAIEEQREQIKSSFKKKHSEDEAVKMTDEYIKYVQQNMASFYYNYYYIPTNQHTFAIKDFFTAQKTPGYLNACAEISKTWDDFQKTLTVAYLNWCRDKNNINRAKTMNNLDEDICSESKAKEIANSMASLSKDWSKLYSMVEDTLKRLDFSPSFPGGDEALFKSIVR